MSISVPLTPTITTDGGTLLRGRCRLHLLISRANAITGKVGGVVFAAGEFPPPLKSFRRGKARHENCVYRIFVRTGREYCSCQCAAFADSSGKWEASSRAATCADCTG